jgi:hypothetical protein
VKTGWPNWPSSLPQGWYYQAAVTAACPVVGEGVEVSNLANIVKFGTAPYFVEENNGAQAK